MRRRWLWLGLAAAVLVVPLLGTVALNTRPGRQVAERGVNTFLAPGVQISGLAGHFPADIKLGTLRLADADGVWLSAQNVELRWQPLSLLRDDVDITTLTAASLSLLREPVAGAAGGGGGMPPWRVDVARFAVGTLNVGAALAGQNTALSVTGAGHFAGGTHGRFTLNAAAADGAHYALAAGFDPANVAFTLHAAEPPGGILGHFAGPQARGPLALDVSLAGPREDAALKFSAALGAARVEGAGTLGLNTPRADVVLTVPALAPFGAMAGQNLAGNTRLHLVVAQQAGGADLALSGDVGLVAAPYDLPELVGQDGTLAMAANFRDGAFDIQQLKVTGADFEFDASGSVAQSGVNLRTHALLKQIARVSPGVSGNVVEDGTITGPPGDFSVAAVLSGEIHEKNLPSGPFHMALEAQHLPHLPVGTLTGSGAVENAPLRLDAAFSGDTLTVKDAAWRSMKAQGAVSQPPGAALPEGVATLTIGRLEDFAPFSPVPLRGSVVANFSHSGGGIFRLNVAAQNLLADPRLGTVNGTLSAVGPADALALNVQGVSSAPARLALAGVFNLDARAVAVSAFSLSWRAINAMLQGPAGVTLRPGLAVQHLALGVNGGRIGLDGALFPRLDANLTVQNLPASLAEADATGTLSGTAALTGSVFAPDGRVTLSAQGIRLRSGMASAVPPTDFNATAVLSGTAAQVQARLTSGPDVALTADGGVPLSLAGAMNLHVAGRGDLRLLDPILAVNEGVVRGLVTVDITLTGTPEAPQAQGSASLAEGSVENISTGLNLTHVTAQAQAAGRTVNLQSFAAVAGKGSITGHGTVDLGTPGWPVDLVLNAANASPISSDILTGNLDAALTLTGALQGQMALAGKVNIHNTNINIPQSLPPSVADLPIVNEGQAPPPPPAPAPPVSLDLLVTAKNQIFVRGDQIFAELGGQVHVSGTVADPDPEGGFDLIRGYVSLAGKNLEFTRGNVNFNGEGFMPALDLEAMSVTPDNTTATLTVGGTAAKPVITLASTPPLPSDEILAELLFGQSVTTLSPFQTASLAVALAQLSGVGGGLPSPLNAVRNALGLNELSLTSTGSGPPSVAAGRYVAPGVFVGATQATNGQGSQATVEINLYKGLKLQTSTGTSSTGNSSSLGVTYQFNY
jgi:translocation and assembly module TamB